MSPASYRQARLEREQRLAVQNAQDLAAARALHLQRLRALQQAEADTALPRHWPAWAAVIATLTALVSHYWPWGFAPGL